MRHPSLPPTIRARTAVLRVAVVLAIVGGLSVATLSPSSGTETSPGAVVTANSDQGPAGGDDGGAGADDSQKPPPTSTPEPPPAPTPVKDDSHPADPPAPEAEVIATPTAEPTAEPTTEPSVEPSAEPAPTPTVAPDPERPDPASTLKPQAVSPTRATTAPVAKAAHAKAASPAAVGDDYTAKQDQTLTVTAPGVLANDTGTGLHATLVSPAAHGIVVLKADGSFDYTPSSGWTGADTFTYRASNNAELTAPATVHLNVTAAVAQFHTNVDSYHAVKGTTLTVSAAEGVLANDTGPPDMTATRFPGQEPHSGTLTLNADGSFSYVADKLGVVPFRYVAASESSHTNAEPTTLVIYVSNGGDDALPAAHADDYTGQEDTRLSIGQAEGVLANDDPAAASSTNYSAVVDPPQHGTLDFAEDGSFDYEPTKDWNGTDSFTYRRVGNGTSPGEPTRVTLHITPVDDPPVVADDVYRTEEGVPLVVDVGGGLLANDVDVDGTLTVDSVWEPPEHGDLTLSADGSFRYEPDAGFTGSDSFQYFLGGDDIILSTARIIVVKATPPTLTSADHATFTTGTPNAFGLTSTGTQPINYTLHGAPDWLTTTRPHRPADARAIAGPRLTGTPPATDTGVHRFTILATNAAGTTTQTFTLTVTTPTATDQAAGTAEPIGVPVPADGPHPRATHPLVTDPAQWAPPADDAGDLPATGGPGWLPTALGSLLLALGAAILLGGRRRSRAGS